LKGSEVNGEVIFLQANINLKNKKEDKMKQLFLSLSLTLILALTLAACGSSEESYGGEGETDIQPEAPLVEQPQPGAVEEPQVEAAEPPPAEEPAESAQAEEPAAEESDVIPPTGPVNLNSMSNLLDFQVWNSNNEQIGSVEDIMVDLNSGQISYLMISLNIAAPGAEAAPAEGAEEAAPAEGAEEAAPAEGAEEAAPAEGAEEAAPAEGAEEAAPAEGAEEAAPAGGTALVPVPLTAVEWNAAEGTLMYTGSEPLEQAPTVGLEMIESGDTTWKSEVDSFWGLEGQDTK
jgi:hypothetical protein